MTRWLPQSLFGRLFSALLAVITITLLIVVALIVRERRDLAMRGSIEWSAARTIAETSASLGAMERAARVSAVQQLKSELALIERPSPPPRAREAEQEFLEQIRKQLGRAYRVSLAPARRPVQEVIDLGGKVAEQRRQAGLRPPGPPPGGGGPRRPPGPPRMLDVSVVLPDGEEVVFRTPAPQPAPQLPQQIFLQLGLLTLLLGGVLYVMTRSITQPLSDLARAAETMGRGADVPPLPEVGALELRNATHAFNVMRERLHRYLDSRTRVLAAMSHDLRTPLTRLKLRAESVGNEDLRTRITADLDEMAAMVNAALAMFRGMNDEEPLEAVDIDALLRGLQADCAEMDQSVAIVSHAPKPIMGKPRALKRCLSNLLHNAITYGGDVKITVEDGRDLIVRIRDAGPGIPEGDLERVFEPFFRLESSRNRDTGGSGLGLSIARDIAQSHGGSLTLRNLPAGGLEAELRLPREKKQAKQGK
jgi:signal transduction histidine kinase